MGSISVILAYVGPEVILPVASVLASVIGFLLMVGRAPFRFVGRAFRAAVRGVRPAGKGADPQAAPPPEAPGVSPGGDS